MTRFLVCPACGYHEPSGAAGEDDAGDASDDGGDASGHRRDGGGDGDATSTDDEETPDCPRCGSRRTYRHDDPALPDAETEAYVKFDADSVGER
jgi:DNA-directed RNA polymerase subunit RPC12/RpoP